jgi:hypothetical protein
MSASAAMRVVRPATRVAEPDNRCADTRTADTAATPLILGDLRAQGPWPTDCHVILLADAVGLIALGLSSVLARDRRSSACAVDQN